MHIVTSKTKALNNKNISYRKAVSYEHSQHLKTQGVNQIIPLGKRSVEEIQADLMKKGDFAKDKMQRRTELDTAKKIKDKKPQDINETIKKHKVAVKEEKKRQFNKRSITIY